MTEGAAGAAPQSGGWTRRVLLLAGPIILSNLSTPLLGAVDTAVVGHLPDPTAIGGVGVFLLGMVVMTEGLKSLAGARISAWLADATRSPASGPIESLRASR